MTHKSSSFATAEVYTHNVGEWFVNARPGGELCAHVISSREGGNVYHANCGGAIGLGHGGEPPTKFYHTLEEAVRSGATPCLSCAVGRDKPKNGSGAAQQACDLLVYKGLRCPECGCDTVMAIDIRAKIPSAPFQWVCVCDRNDHDCYYREVTDRLPSSLVAQ